MKKTALIAILVPLALAGCSKSTSEAGGKGGGRGKGDMKFPVELAKVESRTVEYSVTAVGSVEAFEVVQVTSRVAGVVEQVRFTEGRKVAANQVLVDIEPDRYRLGVESARASVERANAAKADAEAGLDRREGVVKQNPGLIPGEEIETWRTKVRSSAADLALAKVALDQAELNLRDALVKAPVGGVIQSRTVQTGQYVQPGTVLATLLRRDPMLLRFNVAEADASRLRIGQKAYFHTRDNSAKEFSANISHVAAGADERSRMVTVTAEIKDPGRDLLRPGTFAEVRVPVGDAKQMPVIPQTAIRPSERGFLAFVVEKGVAKERTLSIGMRTSDGFVEVLSGLSAGEQLVIRGAEALREGAAVRMGGKAGRADDSLGARGREPSAR
ncbi:MAG: efflux RND transporter periplasmic adaptor subunit [Ignavibacteria bacterium]|nr:efflux RND transporter periplasmic adaptor subunit [Ignavibacteria bacterium]